MNKGKFNKIRASVGEIVPPTEGDKDILVQLKLALDENTNLDKGEKQKKDTGFQQKLDFNKTSFD